MPLGNRLKELRAAKGLNQQGLGSLVGASRQTISLIERGDYNPSITIDFLFADFDFMSMLGEIEDTFDIEVDETEVVKIRTVGEAVDYIQSLAD